MTAREMRERLKEFDSAANDDDAELFILVYPGRLIPVERILFGRSQIVFYNESANEQNNSSS